MAIFNYKFAIPEKFVESGLSFQTYVWLVCQTISPMVIMFGAYFRSYLIAYVVPLFCYMFQLMLVLNDYDMIDDNYKYHYSIGISILIIVTLITVKKISNSYIKKQIKIAKSKILEANG